MPHGLRILVVDDVPDTEEVLRAVLEPRGMSVQRRVKHRCRPADESPAVVIIDDEASSPQTEVEFSDVPQVIIGRTALPARDDRCILAKPFQYAELIQAIEHLVAHRRAG